MTVAITVNGNINWEDYRPWPDGPTHLDINIRALAPASREHGYCLCLHPMSSVIDFRGLTCKWCDQPVTDDGFTAEAKTIRGRVILAAFPQLARKEA